MQATIGPEMLLMTHGAAVAVRAAAAANEALGCAAAWAGDTPPKKRLPSSQDRCAAGARAPPAVVCRRQGDSWHFVKGT